MSVEIPKPRIIEIWYWKHPMYMLWDFYARFDSFRNLRKSHYLVETIISDDLPNLQELFADHQSTSPRSMSVGDVIVLRQEHSVKAYACATVGWKEIEVDI
jgi:hypothetical protein